MMKRCLQGLAIAFAIMGSASTPAIAAQHDHQRLTAEAINAAAPGAIDDRAFAAKLQVLLDRARFSPGVIDGYMGENVVHALAAFAAQNNVLAPDPQVDAVSPDLLARIWPTLEGRGADPVFVDYTITADDVKGPFTQQIPAGFEAKKSLERLGYTSVVEKLGEKFHMDVDLLQELNPQATFDKAGTHIVVAKISGARTGDDPPFQTARIEVDKALKQVRAFDQNNGLMAVYPATVGSAEKPAPEGTYKVKGVARNPKYTYNPDYAFKGVRATKPFTIAPGPNNPVGLVWIDLSKEGYGLHGTPEPSEIGKTASHGCVRLTNWDALALAKTVKPGVPVEFLD